MPNKLKNLKGSKGQIKVGGKMEDTLKRLGIDPQKLVDEEYSWKNKGK